MKIGDKIICTNDENQKVLKKGNTYTIDLIDVFGRIYVAEWKRFAFLKCRFKLVE